MTQVLLLHAFPLDSRMWEAQRRALEGAGHDVVAPELPGPDADIGFDVWAQRVLGEVDGDFVAVGISMGGYLAFELWRQAAGRIPALILADTRATPDTPEGKEGRDDAIRILGEAGFGPFWEGLAPKLFAPSADPAVVSRARAIADEQEITALTSALLTLRDRVDSRPTLATIDVPTLVIVGEEDSLTPPQDAGELEEGIERARLVRIPNVGHLTPLEAPEEFNSAVLSFLDEAGPQVA